MIITRRTERYYRVRRGVRIAFYASLAIGIAVGGYLWPYVVVSG